MDHVSGADPGFQNGGHRSSAEGASIEVPQAPRRVGFGEVVSPSPMGERSGEGAMPPPQIAPSPEIFLIFRPGMLHFEATFKQLTRPVAISLKPAKICDIVASQPVKSLECYRQTKDRKVKLI